MKRAAEFMRSVIPADPFQLFFLAGIACLVIAHGAKWRPVGVGVAAGQPTGWLGQLFQMFGLLFLYLIIIAGIAGYFICFWPGSHPVRRIVGWVFLPTLVAVGLMLARLAYLTLPFSSVLEGTGAVVAQRIHWVHAMSWESSGFRFTFLGLLLIAIFTSRLAFGIASLPLALPGTHTLESEDLGYWRRLQILLWFLVGFAFLPLLLVSFLTFGVPFVLTSRLPSFTQSNWFQILCPIIGSSPVLGIALYIVGKEGRQHED